MNKINWATRVCGIILVWAAMALALRAQATPVAPTVTFTTLHIFDGKDGQYPYTGLVQAVDGRFYGTTQLGGENSLGTVFRITPNGTLNILHGFIGTDGDQPNGLIQGTDGKFYGTTEAGGRGSGKGTVFQVTASGMLTTLYTFCPHKPCKDGKNPLGTLVQATDGSLYGTTQTYGAEGLCCGTVFKVTRAGTLTTLHTFNGTDGDAPFAGLVQSTDGNFYGTTYFGQKLP